MNIGIAGGTERSGYETNKITPNQLQRIARVQPFSDKRLHCTTVS